MTENEDVSRFEFIYEDPYTGNYVYKYVPTDYWPEALEGFISFLRGCSFVISKEDVQDYFAKQVTEYEDATNPNEELPPAHQ